MFDLLFIVSIIGSCVEAVKEALEPEIPAENWANKDLYHEDTMNGVPIEERMKNLRNGKYKSTVTHPEPHRDASGKIIIENSKLYHEDLINHGSLQTMKWVNQGKYNLTKEELKKEYERIEAECQKMYSLL